MDMCTLGIGSCVAAVLLGILAWVMAKQQPNRIANGFVVEVALLTLANGIAYYSWGRQMTDDPGVINETLLGTLVTAIYFVKLLVYAVLGVALIANGVYTVRREGKSLTHVLPLAWGVLLLFDAWWFLFGLGAGSSGSELFTDAVTIVSLMLDYMPFALVGAWFSNDICYKSRKAPETEYIIVLGCSILKDGSVTPLLRGRLDAAIAAWEAGGRAAKIITSGGQGADEVISESQAMANYLLSCGVPQDAILLENKSTTTEENLAFSQAIMDARGGSSHCTIATSSYHCLRAAMFARRANMNVSCVGGRTAGFYYPAAFFREYVALIVRNRYAVALFFVLVIIRYALMTTGILPQSIF